ncbi:MAG: BatA domain-containing protein [Kiritimatiellia bacterium]
MGISFAHPLALWGLLGLPVILAIHFLQSRNRREEVSTLFLLEMLAEETRRGAVFSYLRNGLQLWLQLLAVLLFTLLLAGPMRLHEESIQSIALVVDSSVSMRAFEREVTEEVRRLIELLDGTAAKTEWWILPSDSRRAEWARGADKEEALAALNDFDPLSGPHSAREAIARARQVVGPEGLVVVLSDHPNEDLPGQAVPVSVGHPLDNIGISGVRFEASETGEMNWQLSVVNFGNEVSARRLEVELAGAPMGAQTLELNPGAITTVSGTLPVTEGEGRGEFRLTSDAFSWDDVRPFVLPKPKSLGFRIEVDAPHLREWAERVMDTVSGSESVLFADVVWREAAADAAGLDSAELRFLTGKETGPYARVAPGDHPLVRDLSWEGFLAQPFLNLVPAPGDEVLLWMGEHPLVVLHPVSGVEALWFNFDVAASNADRWPGMVLLLNRFLSRVREGLPQEESLNLETRQLLRVGGNADTPLRAEFTGVNGEVESFSWRNRAPDRPGYLKVWAGEELRLHAGVGAGDSAEGNFQSARPQAFPEDVRLHLRRRNSETEFLLPLIFALLAGTLVAAWWSETRGGRT